ncbi:MAG TPA: PAC2 family protein [Nitrososphaeraceae archaeon]|jgi:uncharacterized protein
MKANREHQKGKLARKNRKINSKEAENDTKIFPIPKSHFKLNNAVMIAGFPSPGMIGSIVCNQLIEQLDLHQIAYIHSKYITPGVIWVGGKIRHPFRIYSNKHNSVCLLICDVPVIYDGMDSVSGAISSWCLKNKVNKVFIVSGIYPDNMNPFPDNLTKRKAFVIENDGNFKSRVSNIVENSNAKSVSFAFIGGLPGQVLANCVVRFMHCVAILVPTFSFTPDPEGAALVIEALGDLIPNAKVSTLELKQEADKIKAQLSELGKLQHRLSRNSSENAIRDETEQIYK